MNDFKDILVALGRGFIKILISALVGVGVGLLLAGISMRNRPDILNMQNWRARDAETFIGIGAGLLSGGTMLLILFLVPWMFKKTPERRYDEDLVRVERAPPERKHTEERPPDRPSPAPRGEEGEGGYYSK